MGVISSIAIAILLIAVPLFFAFKAVYSRIRSHTDEMEIIRGNLAEGRLKALQEALPETSLTQDDLTLNQMDYQKLISKGFTLETINERVATLLEGGEISEPQEEFYAIAQGIRVCGALRDEALSRLEKLWAKVDVEFEVIEDLAQRGRSRRNLEQFLIREGTFGTDPRSEAFKAGMELIQYQIGVSQNKDILDKVNAIREAIANAPKGEGLEFYLQKEVRERIDILMQTPSYELLLKLEGRKNLFVRFVQELSVAIRLESHGIKQLHLLGAKYLEKVKEDRGELPSSGRANYLANALDDVIGKHHWSYKIESLFDKLLVYARYPEKTAMARISHQPNRALDYNSYQVGNHDMAYGNYSLGGGRMRAINGPTPTSDHLLQGQLDAQSEIGAIHLQHNLEHPSFSRGDLARIEYLMSVEEKYPESFRLISTPLDGPAWRLDESVGEYFTDYSTAGEFFLKYGTFAFYGRQENPAKDFAQLQGDVHRKMEGREDNGFYIGPEVMSDEQFRLAFECAAEAFECGNLENEPEKKRLTKALQVGVQGFIAVGAMIKTLKDVYPDPDKAEEALLKASFGQACKLDIDRGVVLNVITRVYFQVAAGKELDEQAIAEIIGTVIGRAELVSGRTIISDRYQPLSDALRLIGQNEENVRAALQKYLREGFDIDSEALAYQSSS